MPKNRADPQVQGDTCEGNMDDTLESKLFLNLAGSHRQISTILVGRSPYPFNFIIRIEDLDKEGKFSGSYHIGLEVCLSTAFSKQQAVMRALMLSQEVSCYFFLVLLPRQIPAMHLSISPEIVSACNLGQLLLQCKRMSGFSTQIFHEITDPKQIGSMSSIIINSNCLSILRWDGSLT